MAGRPTISRSSTLQSRPIRKREDSQRSEAEDNVPNRSRPAHDISRCNSGARAAWSFILWAEDTWVDSAIARKPRAGKFYQDLKKEIKIDNQEVSAEYEVVTRSFSDLELWEHCNLSNDPDTGHTASLRQRLEAGENPFAFDAGGSETRQKYGWLYWVHLQLRTQKSDHYKSTSISGKLDPTNSKYLDARVLLGEDILHSWYGAAPRVKFGYLEDVVDRTPSYDLDTCECFMYLKVRQRTRNRKRAEACPSSTQATMEE